MAHKKLTIPKCLCCGKRLTPQFKTQQVMIRSNMATKEEKTGIYYFGKAQTDDMLCSYYCGVVFTRTIIQDPTYMINDYIKLRYLQLQNAVTACLERGFKEDAQRYVEKYNAHHRKFLRKDFLLMADVELQDLKIEVTHKRIDIK